MGAYEVLFLFITNLRLMWNPVLVISLLVLGISFLQDIINMLLEVLDPFKKFGYPIYLNPIMKGLCQ